MSGGASPSEWGCSELVTYAKEDGNLSETAISSLELLGVNGSLFLQLTETDLRDSEDIELSDLDITQSMVLRDKLIQLEHDMHGTETDTPASSSSKGEWIIPAICVDEEGNSYFTDKRIPMPTNKSGGNSIGSISEAFPSRCVKFREVPGNYDFDWHPAPCRQLVVSLDAGVEIETSKDSSRVFPIGTVMLVEDTWGRGHKSRSVGGRARKCLFIELEDTALS